MDYYKILTTFINSSSSDKKMPLHLPVVKPLLQRALREDIGSGDITTKSCISPLLQATAIIRAKQRGILCGSPLIAAIIHLVDPSIKVILHKIDGEEIREQEIIALLHGSARSLLMSERVIVNFLQHLSGIATITNTYVREIGKSRTILLDTRKTIPGLRHLQKYAVKIGGGENHRLGLYDMVLIKNNHIKAVGSIRKAVQLCRANAPSKKIEVECASLDEVKEALETDCEIIMLDNMGVAILTKALALIRRRKKVEISGGITLANIKKVANLGADYISVGALTHSVPALDVSMKLSFS